MSVNHSVAVEFVAVFNFDHLTVLLADMIQ